MKRLLTASALMLTANLAVAGDFYGGFASPDLETTVGNGNGGASAPTAPSAVRVSLYDFYQGDPDVAPEYSGAVSGKSFAQAQPTAYDDYVRGDPDIDTGNVAGPFPYAGTQPMVASR
jgi:hypothetical protein